ncbi:unnamed protein product [Tuber aestivum]|uniref:Uncharacterized protein n=1 Tax=Tuber aestivum TaxID=59557 RepID=A0A292PZG0_9PEZI|nr:unnamed protein product [Tuber aestivum]
MAYNYSGRDYEMSSSSNTQLNQLNHPYTSVDTSQSQSEDKPTTFYTLTNAFLASLKPKAHLSTDLNGRGRNKPWRPFTLQPPAIMAFLLITIALIALVEYINKVSLEEKALVFAERVEDFSTGVVFCYRYLPQMIVVALGVGWAAVDLDVKRLEPYFQLSKPGGATAGDSIFLHYPYDFIAFVPVNAARKGHWNVFCAGLALCLIFWVVTPLNSSLLTTQPVTRDIETVFKTCQKLTPFDDQRAAMSASFLYTSYGVTWLGEKVHAFMTKELIAVPFKPENYSESQDYLTRGSESWTAQTKVYQTELTCTPAEIEALKGNMYSFNTDKCTYTIDPLYNPNGTRNMMYIGFANDDGTGHYYLPKLTCKDPNLFLAIWAKSHNANNRSDELDLNALYCKPNYHYQTNEVTVEGADGSILNAVPYGERTSFTQDDKIIDIIVFEGNVGAAATASGVNAKHFAPESPDSVLRFERWDLDNPTGQISYVIGLSPGKEFDDFKTPRTGLERMHKLLFNSALETLLVPDPSGEEVVGNRLVRSLGIVVVPVIAHILAGFLGAAVVCLGGVLLISYSRQNNLASDPDALGAKMALVARSETLLRDFDGADECPAPHLCLEQRRYELATRRDEGGYRLDVVGRSDNPPVKSPHSSCTTPHDGKLVGPVGLSIWTGLAVTVVNAALLVLLIALYRSASRWNGLPVLSDTQLMTQVIFSFIPTVIATLLEPFWVLVGRYLALYQPYTELQRGNAPPGSSLGLKYTNTPPVLIAPRALRRGHINLSLASMMVIVANFLAVVLGGIFNRSFKPITSDLIVEHPFMTSINTEIQMEKQRQRAVSGTFAQDTTEHWLVVNTNVIEGTELPAWVTEEFYFLPFRWDNPGNKSDLRTSATKGYGGNLTCQLLAGDTFQQVSGMDGGKSGAPTIGINLTMPLSENSSVHCGNNKTIDTQLLKPGTHPFAVEWVWGLEAPGESGEKAVEACSSLILAGWGRGEANRSLEGQDGRIPAGVSATIRSNTTIICSQKISTGEFSVTVDGEGRVKRSKLVGELRYNDPGIFNLSTTVGNFTAQLATLFRAPPRKAKDFGIMHNDNSSHSFSQFIGESLIGKTLSDPTTPSPDFEDAQRALSKFYKRFITILFSQNRDQIFAPAVGTPRAELGLQSLKPRISMDPVMFYAAVFILGFQLISGIIIFSSRPRRILPRFPDTLASEIGFFHASSAMSDVAGTAGMSSAMRRRHLMRLGWTYGYGKFRGSDGKEHVGIERMNLIKDYKEAMNRRE